MHMNEKLKTTMKVGRPFKGVQRSVDDNLRHAIYFEVNLRVWNQACTRLHNKLAKVPDFDRATINKVIKIL